MQQPKESLESIHWNGAQQRLQSPTMAGQWPAGHLLKSQLLSKQNSVWWRGGGRRYLVVHDAQNQLYDLHLRLFANTRMLHKLHYKCNLINQHICKLFQSSIQRNSTKQNPFCSLNIHDQQAISASRIFIALSLIFPYHPLSLVRWLAWYFQPIQTKTKPDEQTKTSETEIWYWKFDIMFAKMHPLLVYPILNLFICCVP